MTTDEKMYALKALGDPTIRMRAPGDWCCSVRAEIGGDGVLRGRHGNGATPQAAIEDAFQQFTQPPPGLHVVIDALRPSRRAVRWTGFMWETVQKANELTALPKGEA